MLPTVSVVDWISKHRHTQLQATVFCQNNYSPIQVQNEEEIKVELCLSTSRALWQKSTLREMVLQQPQRKINAHSQYRKLWKWKSLHTHAHQPYLVSKNTWDTERYKPSGKAKAASNEVNGIYFGRDVIQQKALLFTVHVTNERFLDRKHCHS